MTGNPSSRAACLVSRRPSPEDFWQVQADPLHGLLEHCLSSAFRIVSRRAPAAPSYFLRMPRSARPVRLRAVWPPASATRFGALALETSSSDSGVSGSMWRRRAVVRHVVAGLER